MNENKYKYSIVIPFYNAEKFINRTLDCLKKISCDDVEFIIINDGSTDDTLKIIKEYNLKNTVIVDKKNGGVSAARNDGIKNASGKYIMFLDGDDWLDENIILELDKFYEFDYDVIKYGFKFSNLEKTTEFKITDNNKLYKKENINELKLELYKTSKFNSTCNQIVKKIILLKNNIYFDETKKYAEDFEFNTRLYNFIENIYLINKSFYIYYTNNNSVTNSYNKNNNLKCLNDALNVYVGLLKKINCAEYSLKDYNDILHRFYVEICTCIKRMYLVDKIKLKEINQLMKDIFNDENYKYLIKKLKENNYKTKNMLDKVLIHEKINYNFLILNGYKIRKILKKYIKNK